jgi:hypothetical protein
MTNFSSPEPPQTPPPKKPILDFDEMVAVVVAFLTIGAILFWSFGIRREGLLFQQGQRLFTFGGERQDTTIPPADPTLTEQPPRTQPEGIRTTPFTDRSRVPRTALERPLIPLPARQRTTPATPTQPSPRATVPQTPPPATTEPTAPQQLAFRDVPTGHWAHTFISVMAAQQLIKGLSENTFQPDQPITRAEMASLIGQSFESQPTSEAINFDDVPEDTEVAIPIETAVRSGFMRGYSGNIFRPEQEIPRYQVLVALASGLNLSPSQNVEETLGRYDDINQLPDWAQEQVAAATEAGLVVNRPEFDLSSLHPNEPATRAEVTAMIHQALVHSGRLEPIPSDRIVTAP